MIRPFISVVIPCYCSAKTLPAVFSELAETMRKHGWQNDYELILVNDGSPDGGETTRVVSAIEMSDSHVTTVELARNFGQHAAIMAGFARVKGDIVVCMDDDGQTPPSEVFKLVKKVVEGYDIVYASYGNAKKHNSFRRLGSRFNRWTNEHFMNIPKDLEQTSYFACKRFVVDNALAYKNPYPFVEGLLFQSVQSYCNVPVKHRAREIGESGYSLGKLVNLWANGFTSFSVGPLRMATYLGFACSLVGFLLVVFLILRKIVVPDVNEGWTSIMACIVFIGGLLMLMTGLVGEYVGRMYMSINNAPQYVVRPPEDVLRSAKVQHANSERESAAEDATRNQGGLRSKLPLQGSRSPQGASSAPSDTLPQSASSLPSDPSPQGASSAPSDQPSSNGLSFSIDPSPSSDSPSQGETFSA